LRSYFTRHGPGPFVTEDRGLVEKLPEPHNDARGWQGCFRVGAFDAVAARYALAVCGGVDGLALTHVDRLAAIPPRLCTAYECDGQVMRDIPLRRLPDLGHQAQLTRQVQHCCPVFTSIDSCSADRFIETVERELNVQVTLTSAGPSAAEKRRRSVGP
jgi:adenylosuccinate synthase